MLLLRRLPHQLACVGLILSIVMFSCSAVAITRSNISSLVVLSSYGTEVYINEEYIGNAPLLHVIQAEPTTVHLLLEDHYPASVLLEPPFARQTTIRHVMVMTPEALRSQAQLLTEPYHVLQLHILDSGAYDKMEVGHPQYWLTKMLSSRTATVQYSPSNLLGVVERLESTWVLLNLFSLDSLSNQEIAQRVHETLKHTFVYLRSDHPATAKEDEPCIDLNAATSVELQQIIHIDIVRAQFIISMRPWNSLQELAQIPGFTEAEIADIIGQGLACVK